MKNKGYIILGSLTTLFILGVVILKNYSRKKRIAIDSSGQPDSSTISSQQATQFAERLYKAMVIEGTNKIEVINVFDSLQTKEDFLIVKEKFGVRDYAKLSILGLIIGPTAGGVRFESLDLTGWLQEELRTSDSPDFKNYISSIYKKFGYIF